MSIVMTEDEVQKYLQKYPGLILDKKQGRIRKRKPTDIIQNIDDKIPKKKTNKYWNIKLYEYENGLVLDKKSDEYGKIVAVYDSMKEYKRWEQLMMMQKTGVISNLSSNIH
jgi:2,3-bisphosphoglycerate-independent phosphoglycerate mutase